jgi:hypothetical protein
MFSKLLAATLLLAQCAVVLAGEIQGYITDEQGVALKGVRVCLSIPGAAPGDCSKTRFTNKSGKYAFYGLDAGTFNLKVLSGASLAARKADPYPNYAWAPVNQEISLASKSTRLRAVDFTGSFNFSNFQAEFQLTGADFPELGAYDLGNDYVFLKVFTVDAGGVEQNLIFLGQVSDINKLLIEVSVPLSATQLFYEIYSANLPDPVTGTISLTNYG